MLEDTPASEDFWDMFHHGLDIAGGWWSQSATTPQRQMERFMALHFMAEMVDNPP